MSKTDLQEMCEQGQLALMQTQYLDAERTLSLAENRAWDDRDFDTLSRLYLPLQEARRQIRQRCAEKINPPFVCGSEPAFPIMMSPEWLVEKYQSGLLLLGGFGTIEPAIELRRFARENKLYFEVFLGAVYPLIESTPALVIAPLEEVSMPSPERRTLADLEKLLPPRCLLFATDDIEAGDKAVWSQWMISRWEKLHWPFLTAAGRETDPIRRMEAYRLTIRVDPGCELAHQHLADTARRLARSHL